MYKTKIFSSLLFSLIFSFSLSSQTYAPPVGQPGTTAMYKDSSAFVNWATGCHVIRGYQDISNTSLGYASTGDSSLALGQALSNGVVSLGDGGVAICTFQYPIKNGAGPDFAVFENSFDDSFLELALVEVSSDGINYVRFASHSLTDTTTQTGSFGATDATKINNLAGKYRGAYGTPFDLQELAGNSTININSVTHVKLIDVVGSVNKNYAKRDSHHNMINDPWPTGFASGGFDLDAIGVINQNSSVGLKENELENGISIYPNPVNKNEIIHTNSGNQPVTATLFSITGKQLQSAINGQVCTAGLDPGMYLIRVVSEKTSFTKKIIIR